VFCGDPPILPNAAFVLGLGARGGNGMFGYETIINYLCPFQTKFEDGLPYKLIMCSGHGQWNETHFTCASTQIFILSTIF